MTHKLVIIGNGMAPGRMLEHLFEAAPSAYEVTIFNAEPRVNYNRIMLSPVLSGEKTYKDIITHDDAWYERHGVTLHRGKKIVAIDRTLKTVRAEDGMCTAYDRLVIATGSTPIVIPVPGHDLPGVLTYRDIDDVDRMLAVARTGGNAVVIGGGSLSGGEGTILGSMIGALIMAFLRNGCQQVGWPNYIQEIIIGALIVFAVAIDRWRSARMTTA